MIQNPENVPAGQVTINVSGLGSGFNLAELEWGAQRDIDETVADLGLPMMWRVKCVGVPGEEAVVCALRVDDQECRIPILRDAVRRELPLAQIVSEAIHVNRDRLLGPDVSGSPVEPSLRRAQRDLVRLGVRPTRLGDSMRWLGGPAAAFERALRDAKADVQVLVNPVCHAEISRIRTEPGSLPDSKPRALDGLFRFANDGLFVELGTVFGGPLLQADPTLGDHEIRLKINDLRLPRRAGLQADEFVINDTPEALASIGINARAVVNPATGAPNSLVQDRKSADLCAAAGRTIWDQPGFMILHAAHEIRRSAGWLLNQDAADFCLTQLATAFPRSVSATLARYSLVELTHIMRALLEEGISIRNLLRVLDHLLLDDFDADIVGEEGGTAPTWLLRSESVRQSLRRYISLKYSRGSNTLVAYIVDPAIEARLEERKPLSMTERRELVGALAREIEYLPTTAALPVILTNRHIRRRFRNEIAIEFPSMPVVAYTDLYPDLNIQPVARIVR
jgi:hypothetical protein